MIDTCQANTMYGAFYTPNIVATGSSALHQSSYSHHADQDVGVAVIDRWTYYNLEFLEERITSTSSNVTLGELFDSYDPVKVHSDAGIRYDLFNGGENVARQRRVIDFFGNVQGVEVEVDKTSDHADADWRSDLAALRKIMERQKEALSAGNMTPQNVTHLGTDPTESLVPAEQIDPGLFKGAMNVGGLPEWSSQARAVAVLAGIATIWAASTWFDT